MVRAAKWKTRILMSDGAFFWRQCRARSGKVFMSLLIFFTSLLSWLWVVYFRNRIKANTKFYIYTFSSYVLWQITLLARRWPNLKYNTYMWTGVSKWKATMLMSSSVVFSRLCQGEEKFSNHCYFFLFRMLLWPFKEWRPIQKFDVCTLLRYVLYQTSLISTAGYSMLPGKFNSLHTRSANHLFGSEMRCLRSVQYVPSRLSWL